MFLVPNILVIHFKRFDNFQRKIKKFVKYDNRLNLTKFTTNKKEDYEYKLFSVLVHEGFSINSGHYYCHVKNSDGLWYTMNDSWVSKTNEKTILQQTPYLLFYERVLKKNYTNKIKESNLGETICIVPPNTAVVNIQKENIDRNIFTHPRVVEQPVTISNADENKNEKIEKLREETKVNMIISPASIISKISDDIEVRNEYTTCEVLGSKFPKNFQTKQRRKMSKILKYLRKIKKVGGKLRKNNLNDLAFAKNKITPSVDNDTSETLDSENSKDSLKESPEESPKLSPKGNAKEKINKFQAPIPNNKIGTKIYNRNLTNLYGSDKIELWDTEEDSDLLKKQIGFIKSVHDFKEKQILEKDEYDVDYDVGKLKKVKTKETIRHDYNIFQNIQDRNY